MSFLDSIWGKIEVSLTLTVANSISDAFRDLTDDLTLLKASLMIAAVASLSPSATSWVPRTIQTVLEVSRSIAVVISVRIILSMVQPKVSDRTPKSIIMDLRATTEPGELPLSVWPLFGAFVASSLTIVASSFVARVSHSIISFVLVEEKQRRRIDDRRTISSMNPEVMRVVYSIQYTFADTIPQIFVDARIRMIVSFVGAVFITPIGGLMDALNSDDKELSALSMWVGGASMAWMNMVVSMVIPADSGWSASSPFDIMTALSLSVLLQAIQSLIPGLTSLQGYLEWHVANAGISLAISKSGERGSPYGYAMAASSALVVYAGAAVASTLFERKTHHRGDKDGGEEKSGNVAPLKTILDISTIVIINCSVKWFILSLGGGGGYGGVAVIIMWKCFAGIYSSMAEAQRKFMLI